jgi:hypothetical protein
MAASLCETCDHLREVVTPRGSRFLLCRLSVADPAYPKYPRQPVVSCPGYRTKESAPAAGVGETPPGWPADDLTARPLDDPPAGHA